MAPRFAFVPAPLSGARCATSVASFGYWARDVLKFAENSWAERVLSPDFFRSSFVCAAADLPKKFALFHLSILVGCRQYGAALSIVRLRVGPVSAPTEIGRRRGLGAIVGVITRSRAALISAAASQRQGCE